MYDSRILCKMAVNPVKFRQTYVQKWCPWPKMMSFKGLKDKKGLVDSPAKGMIWWNHPKGSHYSHYRGEGVFAPPKSFFWKSIRERVKSLLTEHIWENKSYTSLIYLVYKRRALNFAFRKLEFDTINNTFSNKSPFK